MELSMAWPSTAISLESLRPLSPDNFEDDQIASDVDKLSRSELAGKLLDHFDGIQDEESDPFGWYAHEKSVEIPIFESLPSPPYNIDLKPPTQDNVYLNATTFNAGDYEQEPVPQQSFYQSSSPLAAEAYDPLPSFYSSLSAAQPFEPASAVVPLAQPSSPLSNHVGEVADYNFGGDVKDDFDPAAAAAPPNTHAEWLKREALTPPDSPKEEEILKMLEEIESADLESLMANADQFVSLGSSAASSLAQKQPAQCASPAAYTDDDDDASSSSEAYDDPEWTPPERPSTKVNGRRTSTSKYTATPKSVSTAAAAKRRTTKPYSRPCAEERRERKKEQNKNAATRYRLKKKAEVVEAQQEELLLEEKNVKLRKEVDELCREIGYLKSLMRDVYRRRGLIK